MPQTTSEPNVAAFDLAVTAAIGYDTGASPIEDPVTADIDCVVLTIEQS